MEIPIIYITRSVVTLWIFTGSLRTVFIQQDEREAEESQEQTHSQVYYEAEDCLTGQNEVPRAAVVILQDVELLPHHLLDVIAGASDRRHAVQRGINVGEQRTLGWKQNSH